MVRKVDIAALKRTDGDKLLECATMHGLWFGTISASEEQARRIYPGGTQMEHWRTSDWCEPEHVKADKVGIAEPDYKEGYVVCASFNAG